MSVLICQWAKRHHFSQYTKDHFTFIFQIITVMKSGNPHLENMMQFEINICICQVCCAWTPTKTCFLFLSWTVQFVTSAILLAFFGLSLKRWDGRITAIAIGPPAHLWFHHWSHRHHRLLNQLHLYHSCPILYQIQPRWEGLRCFSSDRSSKTSWCPIS